MLPAERQKEITGAIPPVGAFEAACLDVSLRDRFPIRRRKILKKSFVKVARLLLFAGAVTTFFFYLADTFTVDDSAFFALVEAHRGQLLSVWALIVALLLLYHPLYQYLYFRSYFYDIDERNVIIRKGIISKRELTLPLMKITDVSVDQDIFDVLLGLYDVHISTPTVDSGKFAHIDGVAKDGALALKNLILERIHHEDSA